MDRFRELLQDDLVGNAVHTALFAVVVIVVMKLSQRSIRATKWPSPETRRRWMVMSRNVAALTFMLGMVMIWGEELRALALSVVAIAAAIAIALKELILCFAGGLARSGAGSFTIGDRIEIKGLRGDVIDVNMVTTTLMEIGPGHQWTGRAVTLPNALFLMEPVVNESFTEPYVLHTFTISLDATGDWRVAERALTQAAQEICGEYIEDARRSLERVGRREGLETPPADTRVNVHLPEPGRVDLTVRMPTPHRNKGRNEQRVLRRYLDLLSDGGFTEKPEE